MRTGDLVHVPANVTLFRQAALTVSDPVDFSTYVVQGIKHFVTKVPKKALFIRTKSSNSDYCFIEYGENMWTVNTSDITLLED